MKYLAVIIIVLLVLVYLLSVLLPVLLAPGLGFFRILIAVVLLGLIAGVIIVFAERIKELEEEDKDDLGKY